MLYVNGECFGLTPEEIRTMLGSPDVEPSKPKRRLRLRKVARKTLVAAGTVFVAVILPLMMFASCTGGR